MADFFEIDFLGVETKKSGDAIAIRYCINDQTFIHVVDGGFQDTGPALRDHINRYYGNPLFINHVVVTHPDRDHAGGLRTILEDFGVGALWMLRPWIYAEEIIGRFSRFQNVDNLKRRLKEIYPNIAVLEEIAERRNIPILEPFQGAAIGSFHVMAPTRSRYLDLIVESDKTPEAEAREREDAALAVEGVFAQVLRKAANFVRAAWGYEVFSPEETSAENEMSVVQYAFLNDCSILLTGDAGRAALTEVANYAPPGLFPRPKYFQVPHHGSRRNVSTELLDRLLGPRLAQPPAEGEELFHAIISSAKEDDDHPRKAVVRACIHRGGKVAATEGKSVRFDKNAPDRGWVPIQPLTYPEDQEE